VGVGAELVGGGVIVIGTVVGSKLGDVEGVVVGDEDGTDVTLSAVG